jgi:hypothetical protein
MEHVTSPTRVPARPTQPTETIANSTPAGRSEEITAEDIDILLDTVPVPFDFSLARHHLVSRGNGENEGQIEETALWWYHPIFEARAKADIHRTLSGSLPSDPSQDPSPIGTGSWKAEVRPRRSGAQIWAERLEDAFGSGPLDRGLGLKPGPKSSGGTPFSRRGSPDTCKSTYNVTITSLFAATGSCHGTDVDSLHTQNGADTEVVIGNSRRSTPAPRLELSSRNRSPSPEDVADEALHPPDADGMVLVEAANGESEATALTAALTPLVTTLNKTKMVRFIDAPGEVDRANERGSVARDVVNVSEAQILGQTLTPTSTPSLGSFLLDIGSNTPRHQQASPSRRRGTNEQEGSPLLEDGKFPLLVPRITVLMLLAVRMVRSSKSQVRPTGRLAAAVPVFPLRG